MSTTSITLEIDPARLADAHVAKAVAAVMLAMESYDARHAAQPAPPTAPSDPEAERAYRAFVEHLPEPSQRFLALLESMGTLTITDAVAKLGLAKPKSLGGITGAIVRWAPTRGSKVPFEKLTIAGERAWRWIGV